MRCSRSARTAAGFVVFRHERDGLIDNESRWRMRLIVPHIRRAALIGKTLDLKEAQAATFVDVFDGISAAMLRRQYRGRPLPAACRLSQWDDR